MTIDKLFKRFMKEEAVFGSDESKSSLMFMIDYSEALHPFNSFRWDTTIQGHLYWFERAANWLIYLYNNCDSMDDELAKKEKLSKQETADKLYALTKYFKPTEVVLTNKFAFWNEATDIFNKNGIY